MWLSELVAQVDGLAGAISVEHPTAALDLEASVAQPDRGTADAGEEPLRRLAPRVGLQAVEPERDQPLHEDLVAHAPFLGEPLGLVDSLCRDLLRSVIEWPPRPAVGLSSVNSARFFD
ncbi:MAG: hypothetical protein ACREOV_07910 [Candidatus Dormibacteraceae bacterium]